jgi:hypothetical protein
VATVSRSRTLPQRTAVWVRRHPSVFAFGAVCGPGLLAGLSDVTGNDPAVTGKIALAHLNEVPDYYTRLDRMEEEAKRDRGIT